MQLHTLRMTPGMTSEECMASFKMLTTRTGFNKAALEDMYIHGLPQLILLKVYSQTSLPLGLASWKAVIHNLDWLQRGFAELKQLFSQTKCNSLSQTSTWPPQSQIPRHPWTSIRASTNKRPAPAITVMRKVTSRITA